MRLTFNSCQLSRCCSSWPRNTCACCSAWVRRRLLVRLRLLQALLQIVETRLTLVALGLQALQFLAARNQAGLRLAAAAHAQKVPTDPIAFTTDQAFALAQLGTSGQRLFQRLHRAHAGQPRRQIVRALDLIEQAVRARDSEISGADQTQFALLQIVETQPGEIVQHHRLQIGTEHGLHRPLPARLDAQALGQPRQLLQLLRLQPIGDAFARVQRGLLQGFQ